MLILSPNDIFIVRRLSLIADYDKETLFNLYQPLVGASACALYMTLLSEAKNQRVMSYTSHEDLLVKMQLSTQEFLKARGFLEAVGLLRTYIEDAGKDLKMYHYDLYAPKTPKSFFDDVLLYGMLIKFIGEGNANRLKSIYHEELVQNEEYTEVSKTFGNIFHPDFSDAAFSKALDSGNNRGRKTAKIDFEFNYDRFFNALSEISQINKTSLTKKEMVEIQRLASLYGVDEVTTANIVNQVYDPTKEKGSRLDSKAISDMLNEESNYRFLTKNRPQRNRPNYINSEKDLANKINFMEQVSPIEFLSYLQNATQPALSDVKLINDISKQFQLNDAVINVLIDFVLQRNNNILSYSYTQKVAASLAREGVNTAIDAMNYLNKVLSNNNNSKINSTCAIKYDKISDTEENNDEEEVSWEELIARLSSGGE